MQMIEPDFFNLYIVMISGREHHLVVADYQLDSLYDTMFGRCDGDFHSFDDIVINITQIESIEHKKIEREDCDD